MLLFVAEKMFLSRTLPMAVIRIIFLVVQMGPSIQYVGGSGGGKFLRFLLNFHTIILAQI